MASSIRPGLTLPPPHLLLFDLVTASAAVGCTSYASSTRFAALPVLSTSSYYIIRDGALYMRPRRASLLGGFSIAVLLRYLDIGLISRWNFEDIGPAQSIATLHRAKEPETSTMSAPSYTLLARIRWGWYILWSFRQVNSPYEVRNVPRFASSNPHYIPSRRQFVLQQAMSATTCYLLLDLLG